MRNVRALRVLLLTGALVFGSIPSTAQQIGSDDSSFENGVLVTFIDVQTCPYRLVQRVQINVTEDFDGPNNRPKVFAKFHKVARSLKVDAIVQVERGGSHMTAWAFTRREYIGKAVRFVDKSCAPKE